MGYVDVPEDETVRLLDELSVLLDDERVMWEAFWWTKLPWWMLSEPGREYRSHDSSDTSASDRWGDENAAVMPCGCRLTRRRQEDKLTDSKSGRYRFACLRTCETWQRRLREQALERQRAEEERLAKMTPYERYLQSEEWEVLRQKVFDRDRRRCRRCGERKSLHCHHLHYENLYDEPLEDLVTMCKDCHKEVHKFPELHPDWIQYGAKAQRKHDPEPPLPKKKPVTFGFGSADVGDRTTGFGFGRKGNGILESLLDEEEADEETEEFDEEFDDEMWEDAMGTSYSPNQGSRKKRPRRPN